MSALIEQIESAKRQVRKTAKAAPYLYPQYHTWLVAKRTVVEAKAAERAARSEWYEILGKKG